MLTIPYSQELTSQVALEMLHFHSGHWSSKPAKILENNDYLMEMFLGTILGAYLCLDTCFEECGPFSIDYVI